MLKMVDKKISRVLKLGDSILSCWDLRGVDWNRGEARVESIVDIEGGLPGR
jgi:hypothetical protein